MSDRTITRHDNAPPLAARLELDHAHLAQQAADALALEPLAPILDAEDAALYTARAKVLKGVASAVEKARKAEKAQLLEDGKTVDAHFHSIALPVTAAFDAASGAINKWQTAQLAAARRAEAEQRRQEEEAAKVFDEPAPAPVAPIAAKDAARVVSATTGAVVAAARTKWKHRVVDASAVPREYLVPNSIAIQTAVDGGVREIPGVEIFETVQTAIR